jgi:glycosyltransferase involved in cell wall biosynthesis
MKLSIILPVYNAGPYLERCINSLQDQNLPTTEYEIIVVNDGSPDNSRDVALRLQQLYSNIILINQENKGVSLARNAGIFQAQGDYLLFIDPDDYVLPNTLVDLIEQAYVLNAHVSFLGYYFLNVNGNQVAAVLHEQWTNKLYTGIEAYFLSRGNGKTDPDRSWAILYQREFMSKHELWYAERIPYLEDGEFIARVLCLAEKCIFSGSEFYMRTTRPGSATNSDLFNQERSRQGFIRAAKNLVAFSKLGRLSKKQRDFLNQPIAKFTLLSVQSCASWRAVGSIWELRRTLLNSELVRLNLNGVVPYYKKYGRLYNFSILLFFTIWIFRQFLLLGLSKLKQ